MKTYPPLIFLVYDGIENAVFYGQVIVPLLQRIKATGQPVHLISFELVVPAGQLIERYQNLHPNLHLHLVKRWRFWGDVNFYRDFKQLRTFLYQFKSYEIIARGALAGRVALFSGIRGRCTKLVIQARGLLAEEYAYQKKDILDWQKYLYRYRTRQFFNLEKMVYSAKGIEVEVVTSALGHYLKKNFQVSSDVIRVAQHDIPQQFDRLQVQQWRRKVRQELKIASDTYVYCYNGSVKSWQRPERILDFFKESASDKKSLLLILSPDYKAFEEVIKKRSFSRNKFCLCSVSHTDMYQYLAVADVGLMFRESHIISWVSRPVKAMEYEAVGLPIIHNDSVAWLNERHPQ